MGDFARLSQVLSNLLDNASKFTADGGELTLSVQAQGSQAMVAVRDNGRGVPVAARSPPIAKAWDAAACSSCACRSPARKP